MFHPTFTTAELRHTTSRCRLGVILLLAGLCLAGLTCTSPRQQERVPHSLLQAQLPVDPVAAVDSVEPLWKQFDFRNGDFMFAMPTTPVEVADSVSTPIGPQSITRFQASAAGCDFDAGYLQRSSSVLARLVSEESLLKSACEGTAAHLRGRVIFSAALTLDGHRARELRIRLDDDNAHVAAARLVMTDDRIYHAIVHVPVDASQAQGAAARRFLDSLHPQHLEASAVQ